jgi:hypothetical protein
MLQSLESLFTTAQGKTDLLFSARKKKNADVLFAGELEHKEERREG